MQFTVPVVAVLLYGGALVEVMLLAFGIGVPLNAPSQFNLGWLSASLGNSLCFGVVLSIACVPTAFLSARALMSVKSAAVKLVLLAVLLSPLLTSIVLRFLGFASLLGDRGMAGRVLGIEGVLYTDHATMIGLTSITLPLCTLVMLVSLLQVPLEEVSAAENLGATPWQVVRYIEIPRVRGAAVFCSAMCLLTALGDFFAQSILGGGNTPVLGRLLMDRMKINDWQSAAQMALLLAGSVVLFIVVFSLWTSKRK